MNLEPGTEFTVKGEGRFRFDRLGKDGSLTAWGPVTSSRRSWRSFRPEVVRTVHRKKVGR